MSDEPTNAPQPPAEPVEPFVPQAVADRARHYARVLIGQGVSVGALLVAAAVKGVHAVETGERMNYLIAVLLAVFGVSQAVMAWRRYRQLGRYLACGSGSKYEDLVKAAGERRRPPEE